MCCLVHLSWPLSPVGVKSFLNLPAPQRFYASTSQYCHPLSDNEDSLGPLGDHRLSTGHKLVKNVITFFGEIPASWFERWTKTTRRKRLPASVQGCWVRSEAAATSQQYKSTKMLFSLTWKAGGVGGVTPLWWVLRLMDYWKQPFSYLKEIHRVNSQRHTVKMWVWERQEQEQAKNPL